MTSTDKLPGEALTQTRDERNAGILQRWMPRWVINTFLNHPRIYDEFQRRDMSVDSLPRARRGEPAVIIGSGPSLDKTAPLLRNWHGKVFSTLSNAIVAARWGHKPDYICNFDAGANFFEIRNYDWTGSMLVTHPAVDPKVLDAWDGRGWKWNKRYYLMMHLGQQWFDTVGPIVFGGTPYYPGEAPVDIRIAFANAGCTVNNEIQLANWLGYSPLFLIGVDFGFPGNQMRCTGWRWHDHNREWMEALEPLRITREKRWQEYRKASWRMPGEKLHRLATAKKVEQEWREKPAHPQTAGHWEKIEPPAMSDLRRPLHRANNGVLTTEVQIEYKIAMLTVYGLDKPQLIDCSDGIVTELPKADFEEVVRRNGRGFEKLFRTRDEIKRVVDAVLDGDKVVSPQGDDHRRDEALRDASDSGIRQGQSRSREGDREHALAGGDGR